MSDSCVYLVMPDENYYAIDIFNIDHLTTLTKSYNTAFHTMKNRLADRGIDFKKYSEYAPSPNRKEILFFFDMPKNVRQLIKLHHEADKYLVFNESPVVRKEAWDRRYHQFFKKIFTYYDDWIDDKKYIKVFFPFPPHSINQPLYKTVDKRTKLCCMISAYHHSYHSLEIYTERNRTVRWFDKHHPEDFDLFGKHWEEGLVLVPFKILQYKNILRETFGKTPSVYRGETDDKDQTMQQYRFSICYENTKNLNGYITEKIFDCFYNLTIPVFWGAPNISTWIPSNTYIDRTAFTSHKDLYNYMKNMDRKTYMAYIDNIINYLQSDIHKLFSTDHFVKTILQHLDI